MIMSGTSPRAAAIGPGRRRIPTPIMLPQATARLIPRPTTRRSCAEPGMGAAIGSAGVRETLDAVLESVLMMRRWTSLICVLGRFHGQCGPQRHVAASRPWLVYAAPLEWELLQ